MHRPSRVLLASGLVTALLVVSTGCGSSGSDADDPASTTSTTVADGSSDVAEAEAQREAERSGTTIDDPTDDPAREPIGGGDPIVALTSAELCERIDPAMVSDTLGLEVVGVEETMQSTPQCSIGYGLDTGVTSNVTVASMRPDDIGGRTGAEAFDYVVDVNRSIASGEEVEESTPEAGDRALRLSGSSLHLGIVAAGDHLLTVIVPASDATGEQVDDFLVALGDAVA